MIAEDDIIFEMQWDSNWTQATFAMRKHDDLIRHGGVGEGSKQERVAQSIEPKATKLLAEARKKDCAKRVETLGFAISINTAR